VAFAQPVPRGAQGPVGSHTGNVRLWPLKLGCRPTRVPLTRAPTPMPQVVTQLHEATTTNKALALKLAEAARERAALGEELRRSEAQKARLEALCRALRVRGAGSRRRAAGAGAPAQATGGQLSTSTPRLLPQNALMPAPEWGGVQRRRRRGRRGGGCSRGGGDGLGRRSGRACRSGCRQGRGSGGGGTRSRGGRGGKRRRRGSGGRRAGGGVSMRPTALYLLASSLVPTHPLMLNPPGP
jgi:hypothetical protein